MNSRPGFSFTEILFAVIILGIGFIMIAAIFPVAIQQGKVTTEEGSASVAREALNYLGQVGANSDSIANNQGGPLFPATGVASGPAPHLGQVLSFRDIQPTGQTLNTNQNPSNDTLIVQAGGVTGRTPDELWNRLNLSLIVPSDQRYAFAGLYLRNGDPTDRRTWSPFVQAWFIPITARARSILNPAVDPYAVGTAPNQINPNLQPRLVRVSIDIDPTAASAYSTTSPPAYVLYNWSVPTASATPTGNYTPGALFENCYVIIANDYITSPNTGRMNGHIYHVGLRRPDLDNTTAGVTAYDLNPNGTFTPDPGANGYFANANGTPGGTDIVNIGLLTGGAGPGADVPLDGKSLYGNATQHADAYVVGVDNTPGVDPGQSQDISAFTTFIKVN